jgi:predicted ATP-grasp superfamily ATP-dependent carboligase
MDPEGILSFNVNVSNLLPMVKMMEEQYRANKRLERELRHYETEIARLQGGR